MEFGYGQIGGMTLVMLSCCWAALAKEECPQAIFAFGASMSDTGNSEAAFPYQSVAQSNPPYGNTFFGRPANRFSDGRVVLDFFGESTRKQTNHAAKAFHYEESSRLSGV